MANWEERIAEQAVTVEKILEQAERRMTAEWWDEHTITAEKIRGGSMKTAEWWVENAIQIPRS